ncbi:MAG TPA: hypothetical protein VN442_09785 [Bryobacteraceae bacterium]|nr:hypothetical protein [Bryobacteraceae bacterium]
MNGLRISLAVEADEVVVAFQNTAKNREMILPLGQILGGRGSPGLVQLHIVSPDGTRRRLRYTGGPGVMTGQILPYVVPMMAGSLYTVRTPLRYWRLGSDLKSIEEELARGAALQAGIEAGESLLWKFAQCYPVKIFWSGHAVSNIVRAPVKAP